MYYLINQFEFKPGVKIEGLKPVMFPLIVYASNIHFRLFNSKKMVVTSVTDGKHMKGSKHYQGLAFDVRINDKSKDEIHLFYNALATDINLMRNGCDVVLEKDHIHIEYDPK